MAERTAKDAETGEEIIIVDGEDAEESTPAEQDYELAVDNWLADLGGALDAQVSVYKYDEKSNQPAFVDTVGAQDMEGVQLFKLLRDQYGGGKFRIQMRAGGRIVKTHTLRIEPPPVSEIEKETQALGGDLPALIRELKSGEGNETKLILNMMQQSNQQFQSMMVEMVKAMGNNQNNVPAAPSMTDVIGAVASLQKMAKPDTADPTDLLLKGIELATALKSEGGEANLFSLLQTGVKEVMGGVQQMGQLQPPQPATAPQALPQPGQPMQITAEDRAENQPEALPAPARPEPVLTSTAEVPEQLKPFESYVNYLVQKAAQEKDPALYAELVLDEMPEELALAWIGQAEGRATLMGYFTQAQPYAAWFEAVGNEILALLGGDSAVDPGDDPEHNAGEAPNVIAQDSDVSNGQTTAEDGGHGQPHIDGNPERPGGHTFDAEIDGEVSEPGEDAATNT